MASHPLNVLMHQTRLQGIRPVIASGAELERWRS
jgi:hypothetical protein